MQKVVKNIFFTLVVLSLLTPLWVFKDLLFPYVTSKAFYFRILIEAALPFYVYLLLAKPALRLSFRKNKINLLMVLFMLFSFISSLLGVGLVRSLWGNFERMGGVFYLGHLTLLYFYILALAKMEDGDLRELWSLRIYPFIGLVFGIFFASLIGFDLKNATEFWHMLALIFGISFFVTAARWFSGNIVQKFLKAFLLVALVIVVNGIFGKLGLPILVQDPSLPSRVSSTLGNPIYLGSFLVVPLFLGLFFARQAVGFLLKTGWYFISFLFFIGLLLSGTRGAFAGLVLGVFLASVTTIFLNKNKKVKIFGSLGVMVFIGLYFLLSTFNNILPANSEIQRLFKLKDSNSQARVIQWGIALEGFKESPIFGVGPENYYYISNKYYNPEIYNYDKSWFDKPHNYIIEILVTTGLVGLATYLGLIGLLFYSVYKAFKDGLLNIFEFFILVSALLVYQIQNLFVFDTVPASLSFYVLCGLIGYISIFYEKPTESKISGISNAFALSAFMLVFAVSGYIVFATNAMPILIAKNINYGYAYYNSPQPDPVKSFEYFETAKAFPFNFDKTQTAQKYAESAIGYSYKISSEYQSLKNQLLDGSISAIKDALIYESKYPILWNYLAQSYLHKGISGEKVVSIDSNVYSAINKSIELVPKREESYLTLAQIKAAAGDLDGAAKTLQNVLEIFPKDSLVKLQLSQVLVMQQKKQEAAKLLESVILSGYSFNSYQEFRWLFLYYLENKDYENAFELQNLAEKVEPGNILVYEDLVRLYVDSAQYDLARSLAEKIIQAVPSSKQDLDELIKNIPK